MRYLRAVGMWGVLATGVVCAAEPTAKPAEKPVVKSTDTTQAEHAAYLRRLSACSKLREVAAATNNVDLLAQADRLETLATDLYQKKLKAVESAIMDAKAKEEMLATKKKEMPKDKSVAEVVTYAPNGRPIRVKQEDKQ